MEETSSLSGSSGSSGLCLGVGGPWWGRIGSVIFFIAFLLIFTSYVAPDWIEINTGRAPKDTTFRKLGLWMSCYTNLHDPYYYDPYLTSGFEGCRWIYYPVVSTFHDLRDFLLPSFIIPVQITYTLCFVTVLVLFFMILVYIIRYKINEVGTLPYLIVIGMMLQGAGLLGTISVIVFGALSRSRTWAHEWQFNDLSWAFAVAVAGVVLLHLAGILFLVEAHCQYKKRSRQRIMHGSYDLRSGGASGLGYQDELKKKFGEKA
ncbi:uncharacterized protein LOC110847415 [Folsomia candida]|uniref:uncharacterized protein LOC110847415 n=1 Tax=Folsomia candida TaxID=158441 RepID=UPI000B90A33B|nr:uncharacterized protein LOC110847415 [Folsomia candida]